jgi:hypothetical protein
MGLSEAVKAFEAEFARVVPVPDGIDQADWSRCIAGEPFQTVVSYGVQAPGSVIERTFDTPEEAITAWLSAVRLLTERKRGTLYWRHPAEVEKTNHGWLVYSRFVSTEA